MHRMGPRLSSLFAKSAALAPVLAALVALLPVTPLGADSELLPDAPVERFRIYGFDNKNGWRTWQIDGDRAEFGRDGYISVTGMTLKVFENNGSQNVDVTIKSPIARIPAAKDRVDGPDSISVDARGVHLEGSNWTYFANERRLTLRQRSRAVIKGDMGTFLE